jgi:uncharacterized protein
MMRHRTLGFSIAVALSLLALSPSAAVLAQQQQEEYAAAMEGVTSTDVAFDFRIGDPDVALGHLELIHDMLDAPSMTRGGEEPEIVVVFVGPSVNLVSTDVATQQNNGMGATPPIAEKISAMEEDGIRFEICMTAAHAHGVAAESILPEIEQVGNGWISLVGYQHQGYALIADF